MSQSPAVQGADPAMWVGSRQCRLTDNWLDLTVRREHGIRPVKDAIARAVLHKFDQAALEIASATYEIVGMPPLRLQKESAL
jgi:hypothetical protein